MGNAATVFSSKGIGIDITTPKIETGASQANGNQYMNIPLLYEADKGLDMYLAVTG